MKVLVSFQPNKKASDFEGVRLRKTIKGALEMVGVEYTTSIVDKYDIVHLISPDDENKLNDAKENGIPVVSAAFSPPLFFFSILFLTIVETIASPAGTVKQAIIDLLINHEFE